MLSKQFWRGAAERAVKTFAQTLLALLSAVSVGALTGGGIPWQFVVGAVGASAWAAALSLLSSVASTTVGDPESPSLLRPEPPARHGLPTDLG
ncbi:holin [Nocardia farcinica]|uniref:holin n=1 Tax=Nocardia farcinica TaxID=37329 RepID=UPI001E3F2AE6|nr:holin [Nocardia farcinica]UEX21214.1 holin [Nocardia farcinica]